MKLGIDPKIDYAFKKLFGQERNKPLLVHLLNAVLQWPEDRRVVDLDILNPFNDKETEDERLSILDVKARDAAGRSFNVEMQMIADRYFRQRLLYYWAKLHASQLKESDPYHLLRPTIGIAFVNSVLFEATAAHHARFGIREASQGLDYSDDLALHILELPKFAKQPQELQGPLDAWLYFLRTGPDLETDPVPPPLATPEILHAVKELTMLTQDEKERWRYEARVDFQRDVLTREYAAREEGLEKGLEKGRQEGREEGREVGREEGREVGREEGREVGREEGREIGREEGREVGREEGLEKGTVIGEIQAYRRMLRLSSGPTEDLASKSLEELQETADALARRLQIDRS